MVISWWGKQILAGGFSSAFFLIETLRNNQVCHMGQVRYLVIVLQAAGSPGVHGVLTAITGWRMVTLACLKMGMPSPPTTFYWETMRNLWAAIQFWGVRITIRRNSCRGSLICRSYLHCISIIYPHYAFIYPHYISIISPSYPHFFPVI